MVSLQTATVSSAPAVRFWFVLVRKVLMTFFFMLDHHRLHIEGSGGGVRRHSNRAYPHVIHLVSIPVTNTTVNPARSKGQRCSPAASTCRNSGVVAKHPRANSGDPDGGSL